MIPKTIWNKKLAVIVLVIAVPTVLATVFANVGDTVSNMEIIVRSWLEGQPLMLLILEIKMPSIDADKCLLAVHRLPSPSAPTPNGLSERIYGGAVRPGETVRVELVLPAVPEAYTRDEQGRMRILYYERQEIIVVATCAKNGKQVWEFMKLFELRPEKPVSKYIFDLEKLSREQVKASTIHVQPAISAGVRGGSEPVRLTEPWNYFTCEINCVDDECGCLTWVAGPRLYSSDGVRASYGIYAYPVPSAIYLEAFGDTVWCPLGYCDRDTPVWYSLGKRLTPSIVTDEVTPLEGPYSVRIFFNVYYVYEEWWLWDSFSGDAQRYWLLYPKHVGGVERGDTLGVSVLTPYTPSSETPWYAFGPKYGRTLIMFRDYDRGCGDSTLSISTSITFMLAGVWSATLSVDFYQLCEDSDRYVTPYVVLEGNGVAYYWWFPENDPDRLEVMVKTG